MYFAPDTVVCLLGRTKASMVVTVSPLFPLPWRLYLAKYQARTVLPVLIFIWAFVSQSHAASAPAALVSVRFAVSVPPDVE